VFSKTQLSFIAAAIVLFGILYFGFDTKPKKQAALEESRALNFETTDPRVLLADAKKKLDSRQNGVIGIAEMELQAASDDTLKASQMEVLARDWYGFGYPEVSGYYAEEIAKLRNNGSSWGIAGTTFTLCAKSKSENKVKEYCRQHALRAFENAISEEPDNIDHRLNMALLNVEVPEEGGNPMKGIQMLLSLNEDYPKSVKVLNQLGRLAIQTNQWDRAKERLIASLEIEPNNRSTICMLAKVYQSLQDFSAAETFTRRCSEFE